MTKQIIIEVPEAVLLAEKTDEVGFAQEMRMLSAVKLYELGRLSSGRGGGPGWHALASSSCFRWDATRSSR